MGGGGGGGRRCFGEKGKVPGPPFLLYTSSPVVMPLERAPPSSMSASEGKRRKVRGVMCRSYRIIVDVLSCLHRRKGWMQLYLAVVFTT